MSCLAVLLVLGVVAPPSVHGVLYKCRTRDGRTHYTNVPNSQSCHQYSLKKSSRWGYSISGGYRSKTAYDKLIDTIGKRHDVDPPLIKAIIHTESDFNPRAISRKGALGLMQLMPETARELRVTDPFNPKQNIEGGTRYMRKMLDTFNDNLILSLAAYNAGPTLVTKIGDVPQIRETRRYINKVLRRYRYYRAHW